MDALFEYGIMTEQSDIRAHVSVVRTLSDMTTDCGVHPLR